MWPTPSPIRAFVERRRRLQHKLSGPALIAAGFSRSRNFRANTYPFRASSHFLYFVGRPIEGAVLMIEPGSARLYAPIPDSHSVVWTGPEPTPAELSEMLELEVYPMDALTPGADTATLPPPDERTALWLTERLSRNIGPGAENLSDPRDLALTDAIIDLRLIHDDAAIAQLRQAARATAQAHRAGMIATRPVRWEAEVRGAMEAAISAAGMACSYNPIVTVHGEVLHNERSDRRMSAGELLLADVGAETPEGWAGDVTRTWPVTGRYSPTQREMYQVVMEAQRAAIAAVRPGVRYRDVHRLASRALLDGLIALGLFRGHREELYELGAAALFFPHGVGHLLGLDVHDMEDLGDRAGYAPGRSRSSTPAERFLRLDRDLVPNMALTIEPGVYLIPSLLKGSADGLESARGALDRRRLEQFSDVRGIRIEDDVLVTDKGAEVLTASIPKAIDDVEALVGRG
jgi:Xaa-Pro aminopeptidase